MCILSSAAPSVNLSSTFNGLRFSFRLEGDSVDPSSVVLQIETEGVPQEFTLVRDQDGLGWTLTPEDDGPDIHLHYRDQGLSCDCGSRRDCVHRRFLRSLGNLLCVG